MPEVVGDAGLMSEYNNINKFIKDINLIIDNEKFANELKKKSLARSKNFNIADFHKRLILHYENQLNIKN